MTEEGGFAHNSSTHGILVNEQQGPALLQKEMLNALIYCHRGTGTMKSLGFPAVLSWHTNGILWAEDHPELQGKMLQLGLEICCSSGVFCVPQTLQWSDWLRQWRRISSSSNHISRGRRHRGCRGRSVGAVGVTSQALVLGGWQGASTSLQDCHSSLLPQFPTLIPDRGRCPPRLWEQPRQVRLWRAGLGNGTWKWFTVQLFKRLK